MTTLRDQRKERHECTRCGDPAAPDSDFCEPHAEAQRLYQERYDEKRRAEFKRRRLCVTCGRKRRGGSKHCARCLIRLGRLKIDGAEKGAEKAIRIRERTIVDKSGRTRYLGKQRRGAPAIVDADHDDFTHARAALKRAEDGLDYYKDAKAAMLPRIQLEDLRQAYVGQAFASARILLELCQRAGWTIPGLNDDEIAPTGRKDRG